MSNLNKFKYTMRNDPVYNKQVHYYSEKSINQIYSFHDQKNHQSQNKDEHLNLKIIKKKQSQKDTDISDTKPIQKSESDVISYIMIKHLFQIASILTNVQSSFFVSTHNATRYMLLHMISSIFTKEIQRSMEQIKEQKTKTNYEGYLKKLIKFKNKSYQKLTQYENGFEMIENKKMVVVKAKSTMDFIKELHNNSNSIPINPIIQEIISFVQIHLFAKKGLKFKELQMLFAINSQNKLQSLKITQNEFQNRQIISFLDQALQFNFFIKLLQLKYKDKDKVDDKIHQNEPKQKKETSQIEKNILLKIEKILSHQSTKNENQSALIRLKENLKLSEQIQQLGQQWTNEQRQQLKGAAPEQQVEPLQKQKNSFYGFQFFSQMKETIEESLTKTNYLKRQKWLQVINMNQKKGF